MLWVRVPSRYYVSRSSTGRTMKNTYSAHISAIYGGVAQLRERLVCNQDVAGLTPVTSTKQVEESWLSP